MTAQFRIGGVYRAKGGLIFKITGELLPGVVQLTRDDGWEWLSHWRLSDGMCLTVESCPGHGLHLLPGELHNVNGQWVPVAEEAPTPPEVAEAVKFLAGRMEARKAAANTTERVRPPLTWATPKPFDAFGGFFTEPADIADWQDTYFPR